MGEDGAKAVAPPRRCLFGDRAAPQAMERQAVDVEMLSISPFWYENDRDPGEKVVSFGTRNSRSWLGRSQIVPKSLRR